MLSRRRFLAAYAALATLRVFVAFTSLSSIHPDEHFQNPEVAVGVHFDFAGAGDGLLRTWEWEGDAPCRSIVPVLGSSGRAFQLLRLLYGSNPPATALFAAQRAVMLFLSFSIDAMLWRTSRRSRLSLLLFASSPVVFTFLLRPFSNSLETLFLAAAYVELAEAETSALPIKLVGLGAVLAAGIFTRITFAAFALPLVFAVVVKLARRVDLRPFSRSSLLRLLVAGLPAVIGFLLVSLLCVSIDTAYFHSGDTSLLAALRALGSPRSLVLTPLNLLRYNLSSENLAEHGLHPRWMHAVVNMPMLFGAGLAVVGSGGTTLLQRGSGGLKREDRESMLLHLASIAVPLVLLSLLPHQEPRFLVPLIMPLVLLAPYTPLFRSGTRRAAKARKAACILWLLHSLVFTCLFGYMHQGGLLPALFAVNKELQDPTTQLGGAGDVDVVFWRTFMPPRHLLLPLAPEGTPVPAVRVTDLAGAPFTTLVSTLASLSSPDLAPSSHLVLVAPAYAIEAHNLTCLPSSTFPTPSGALDPAEAGKQRCLAPLFPEKGAFGVHVDMDRLGDLAGARWETAGVGVWVVE
ncbi:alpha 1,2 mannosyltransferase [Rhodotorula kratochvilovae]